MPKNSDLMKYNSLLGVKGFNIRNTFIEFEDEDMLGELDVDPRGTFGRQASEPAKPSSWNRQVSEQTTAVTAEGTEEGTIDVEDSLHFPATDFQGHVSGEILANAAKMGTSDAALLDALKAVNQAVSMNHMPSPMMPTVPQANSPPKPQLRFCPNCGAKVISQAHRFCAYCCFPFSHLQDETVPAKAPETASPMPLVTTPMQMMQGGGGGLDPMQQSLLMNMQQAAQASMPQAAMGNFRAGTRMPPSKDDSLLGSLRYFRYVEADQIDVELAKVLCLTHIRDSVQVAA
mmetsp:Transcript_28156/g.66891  ORF Transcript_28156/g.66891 Transcript_28156/m.66891 type:complete len:288 (-) Transcript_28156:94-957(-)|eukprot:CAMPEP_0181485940 /NCGR_PEP_ID=MMETSP1110-20121109/46844_1 /TAXON_ID=174948 /ORGANISM="Symbiodinium sp., Strain CCMP421" /LENGTH=287 /DNA_ID=CAMNT_0023611995 /DNA_START=52 /DNA_END=915 /DNA_ORIENTATION=+